MREVKHRSALPVYIAAGVFVLYALIFPLYAMHHFLIAALVTAAAWLLADRLIKPVTEYIPEPEPEPVSYGTEADAILAEAANARAEMEKLALSIGDTAVSSCIEQLASLSDRIAQDVIKDPNDARAIRKFQSYFLPATVSLLHAYDRMSAEPVAGETISSAKEGILEALNTEITAFEKQLDSLYDNDAQGIDTDIQVLHKLMERDGLLETDELHELLQKTQQAES